MKRGIVVVLDNIRSTFNVGSIFRTSDALGVERIILCGTTPAPVDRFGRERKDISKVSLGAEKNIKWSYEKKTILAVRKLKKEGFQIISVEQSEKSVDYKKIKSKSQVAFIVGNEVGGISKDVLAISDAIAEIPMLGDKESLNVAVSFGVALFRILNV